MNKPKLIALPQSKLPISVDYACGSYNGQTDFSCKPYGSEGNIDASGGGGWLSSFVGAVISVVLT